MLCGLGVRWYAMVKALMWYAVGKVLSGTQWSRRDVARRGPGVLWSSKVGTTAVLVVVGRGLRRFACMRPAVGLMAGESVGAVQSCTGGGVDQQGVVHGCPGGGMDQHGAVQRCIGGGVDQQGVVHGCPGGVADVML
jgi:hypothetical protein